MKFKKGVVIHCNFQFNFMHQVVDLVWLGLFGHESMCTSGSETINSDGSPVKHAEESLHWTGLAWDIRTRKNNDAASDFIGRHLLESIVIDLKLKLGSLFDVVLEKDHIHIEYDPK